YRCFSQFYPPSLSFFVSAVAIGNGEDNREKTASARLLTKHLLQTLNSQIQNLKFPLVAANGRKLDGKMIVDNILKLISTESIR
ncbi:MAG: hypothetical protein ACP5KD_09255, partial [Fervidobacterium sp.]